MFIAPMEDSRPSTLTIGGMGVAFIITVLVATFLLDVPALISHAKMGFDNIRSGLGHRKSDDNTKQSSEDNIESS